MTRDNFLPQMFPILFQDTVYGAVSKLELSKLVSYRNRSHVRIRLGKTAWAYIQSQKEFGSAAQPPPPGLADPRNTTYIGCHAEFGRSGSDGTSMSRISLDKLRWSLGSAFQGHWRSLHVTRFGQVALLTS